MAMVKCPNCGEEVGIRVEAYATCEVTLDSSLNATDVETGDVAWDHDACAVCPECGHEATYADFLGIHIS